MYYDVQRAYKEHVWGRARGQNHIMDYEVYLSLQYDSIKHVFSYNNKQRQHDVYYIRI